ncbi:unnamed protein product [Ilex paraguariensis]|uniref:WAT1-related protein n=1 Tax=Ilex paraguariensis TaxID=185542 RepID=A0ABC8QT28_9AQUA
MGWETIKPYIMMFFLQFVDAGLALVSKKAIADGMNPFVFVVYRQALATLSLAPFAFFLERKKSSSLSFSLLCKIFLVALCGITLFLIPYYFAINYTSATFAAASTTTVPAVTFILAVFLRMESISIKERHGMAKILGSVVCISGALVFAFVKGPPVYPSIQRNTSHLSTKHSSKGEWIMGSLIMLSAYTAWSLWIIMQGPIVKQYPLRLRLITLQAFFSCIQSALWVVAVDRKKSSWKLGWDVHLLSVAYCGVVVGGISYVVRLWVIEKKGPVFVAIFNPLILIITAIFSAFLWREIIHWGSVCGAIMLVVGLYCVLWGKHKEEKYAKKHQIPESKEEVRITNE